MTDDLAALDAPVRRVFERIAAPAALATPDLDAIGRALADLASDLDWAHAWIARLGDRNGLERIHAPGRGPRLVLVHRPEGEMSAVHDHGTWVAAAPITGVETHRRWRATGDRVELVQVDHLAPATVATLLPPDDIHDHGHLVGHGSSAHTLILLGDNQQAFTRHEWDPVRGRRRTLHPGDAGRWVATEPWPDAAGQAAADAPADGNAGGTDPAPATGA